MTDAPRLRPGGFFRALVARGPWAGRSGGRVRTELSWTQFQFDPTHSVSEMCPQERTGLSWRSFQFETPARAAEVCPPRGRPLRGRVPRHSVSGTWPQERTGLSWRSFQFETAGLLAAFCSFWTHPRKSRGIPRKFRRSFFGFPLKQLCIICYNAGSGPDSRIGTGTKKAPGSAGLPGARLTSNQ